MPKNTKSKAGVEKKEEKPFKFSIVKAPEGTSFSIYLQGDARRYTQGVIEKDKITLEIPATFKGPGSVSITTPRVDRVTYGTTLIHDFTLEGDIVFNVEAKLKKQEEIFQAEIEKASRKPKLASILTGDEKPPEPEKKVEEEIITQESRPNSEDDSKGTFWDRFK